MKKIYLNYKEVETLCFSKVVLLDSNRLDDTKVTKGRSYTLELDPDHLIIKEDIVVILFSSVKIFEIPETELNLFKNHFKIPMGLINLVKRKAKELKLPESKLLIEIDKQKELKTFAFIRRSLIQLFLRGYNKKQEQEHIPGFINNLLKPSDFTKKLISRVIAEECFPLLRFKGFHTDTYFKYVWWGKFIIDNLLEPSREGLSDSDYDSHKAWFKMFDVDDLSKNFEALKNIPQLYKEHSSIILGYFFAIMTEGKSSYDNIGKEIDDILVEIRDVNDEYEVLFWGIFFKSLFTEKTDYIFSNPLIQCQFFNLEINAFKLSEILSDQLSSTDSKPIDYTNLDDEQLILKFLELKEAKIKNKPQILDGDDVFSPFDNSPLFKKSKYNIGLVNREWYNDIQIDDSEFKLKCEFRDVPITYYGDITKNQKEGLKENGINLKFKPFASLIPVRKKVVLGFCSELTGSLIDLYKSLMKSGNTSGVHELVLVWLIHTEPSVLQSTEFALKKNRFLEDLKREFGIEVTLIVKNVNDNNNSEVTRNLKISLKKYCVNQIEIIDYNFDEEKASWVLNATNDYVLKSKDIDYHYFFNG